MTYSYFIPGIGLKAILARAMKDAAVTESSKICDRIAAYMLHSKSDTVKKLFSSFQKWKHFCTQKCFSNLPAEPIHIVLYLTN